MTPRQLRAARAGLDLSLREVGRAVFVSASALSAYERGEPSSLSAAAVSRIERWLSANQVYLGPADAVCFGQNVFEQEAWYAQELLKLLKTAGAVSADTALL